MNLEVGKVYVNGKHTREITKIIGGEIYYKTETGKEKNCWIATFQDWVTKGEKAAQNEKVSYQYEILYTKNEVEYRYGENVFEIETAKTIAEEYKGRPEVTGVDIVEYKTIERRIKVL